MTQVQKIIKYVAISLAIFLIISITSLILISSYTILSSLGLINSNNTKDLETILNEEITSLKIDLAYTNLYIKASDKFEIQTNNPKIILENNGGNIKIKESKNFLNNKNFESNLIIYAPNINEVDISSITGKINIEWLNTKKIYIESGIKLYMENVTVTNNIDIENNVGKIELVNCNLNNLEADLGIGEFIFNGILTGKNEINSRIGNTNINLVGKKSDYTIKVSKGLGSINIDSEEIDENLLYGIGNNYLEIDLGIGAININFIENK